MASEKVGDWTLAELVVRPATVVDREAVLDINRDIYYGLDYLPARYNQFVTCNRHRCFVGELRGKVVGYIGCYIVNGGRESPMVLRMSGRVSPAVQGRGVMPTIARAAIDSVKRDLPGVTRFSIGQGREHFRNLVATGQRALVQRWVSFRYKLVRSTLEEFTSRQFSFGGSDLLPLDSQLVEQYHATLQELVSSVGPFIVYDICWLMDEPTQDTMKRLAARYGTCVSVDRKSRAPSGLSVLARCETKFGLRFDVHFYGQNIQDFFQHFFFHVKQILATWTGRAVAVVVHFPPSIDADAVEKTLEESFGPKVAGHNNNIWLMKDTSLDIASKI